MRLIGRLKTKSSNEIKSSRVGIGFECYDRDLFDPERCYDLVGAMGIKPVRVQTGWARTETEKGVYDFSWLDGMVDNLIKRGMEPWFNVGYGNPIYMLDAPNSTAVGCVPTLYGEECLNAWFDYVKALTEHFKDRITHYEIWNEPDLEHFWYPGKSSPEKLAELIKLTGAVVRGVLPTAKIGFCLCCSHPEFVYNIFSNLEKDEVHFYSAHNYDPFPENGWNSQRTLYARKILDDLGFEQVEIWMGEGGHASWHPVGHAKCPEGGGSEHNQAVWHLRRCFLDLKNGLKLTSIFMVVDLWQKPYEKAVEVLKKPAAQGVINGITYSPKKTYKALTNAANVLSDENNLIDDLAVVEGKGTTCDHNTPVTTVSFMHNGKPCMAYWLSVPVVGCEEVNKPCNITQSPSSKLKDPVVIDMMTGEVFEPCEDEKTFPLREYPHIFCERDTFEFDIL